MGKSFVEEDTRRAVLTLLGRAYVGSSEKRCKGEKGEDARKRIERWKERVENAQRITFILLALVLE
jgi:hypothetical protein